MIDVIVKGVSYFFCILILCCFFDFGMEYEDVFFLVMDGVMLDGWYILVGKGDKLIIVNYFIGVNCYGYFGYLELWIG